MGRRQLCFSFNTFGYQHPDIVMSRATKSEGRSAMDAAGKKWDHKTYMMFGAIRLHKPYVPLLAAYRYDMTGSRKPVLRWGGCECSPRYGLHGRMYTAPNTKRPNTYWHDNHEPLTKVCEECFEYKQGVRRQGEIPTTCEWCGFRAIVDRQIERDHILPQSQGGTHEVSNLQWLCSNCHSMKTHEDSVRYRT